MNLWVKSKTHDANTKQGVWPCHFYIKKNYYLKAKIRRIMETQIPISPCKNIIFPKKILFKKKKKTQNPSRYYYYNSIITNLKF